MLTLGKQIIKTLDNKTQAILALYLLRSSHQRIENYTSFVSNVHIVGFSGENQLKQKEEIIKETLKKFHDEHISETLIQVPRGIRLLALILKEWILLENE